MPIYVISFFVSRVKSLTKVYIATKRKTNIKIIPTKANMVSIPTWRLFSGTAASPSSIWYKENPIPELDKINSTKITIKYTFLFAIEDMILLQLAHWIPSLLSNFIMCLHISQGIPSFIAPFISDVDFLFREEFIHYFKQHSCTHCTLPEQRHGEMKFLSGASL